jgi:hypothetical protein
MLRQPTSHVRFVRPVPKSKNGEIRAGSGVRTYRASGWESEFATSQQHADSGIQVWTRSRLSTEMQFAKNCALRRCFNFAHPALAASRLGMPGQEPLCLVRRAALSARLVHCRYVALLQRLSLANVAPRRCMSIEMIPRAVVKAGLFVRPNFDLQLGLFYGLGPPIPRWERPVSVSDKREVNRHSGKQDSHADDDVERSRQACSDDVTHFNLILIAFRDLWTSHKQLSIGIDYPPLRKREAARQTP